MEWHSNRAAQRRAAHRATRGVRLLALLACIVTTAAAAWGEPIELRPRAIVVGNCETEDEQDRYAIEVLPGERVVVRLKAARGASAVPELRLLRDAGVPLAAPEIELSEGRRGTRLELPRARVGGRYHVAVVQREACGDYRLVVDVKRQRRSRRVAATVTEPHTPTVVSFDGRTNERMTVRIDAARRSPVLPRLVSIMAPSGLALDLGDIRVRRSGRTIELPRLKLPELGRYTAVVGSEAGSTGDLRVRIRRHRERRGRRRLDLADSPPPLAMVDVVSPRRIIPSTQELPFAVHGANFAVGATVSFPSLPRDAVVSDVVRLDSETIVGRILVPPGEVAGTHAVRVHAPNQDDRDVPDALRITRFRAPAPARATGHILARGTSGNSLLVEGTEFQPDDVLRVVGASVEVDGTQFVDHERLVATVTVAPDAPLGPRTLEVVRSTAKGGEVGALSSGVEVVDARPSIESVTLRHVAAPRGEPGARRVRITVTGRHFASDSTVRIEQLGGEGVNLASETAVRSSTQLEFTAAVTPQATTGTWELRVESPTGEASSELPCLMVVEPTEPALTSVTPSSGSDLGGQRVLVEGGGFAAGVAVSFGGSRATRVQVLDPTRLLCDVPPLPPGSNAAASDGRYSAITVPVELTLPGSTAGAAPRLERAYEYATEHVVVRPSLVTVPGDEFPVNVETLVVRFPARLDAATVFFDADEPGGSRRRGVDLQLVPEQRVGVHHGRFVTFSRAPATEEPSGGTGWLELSTKIAALSGVRMSPLRAGGRATFDHLPVPVGPDRDDDGPMLLDTTPTQGEEATRLDTPLRLQFSEALDPRTVDAGTVELRSPVGSVPVAVQLADDLRSVELAPPATLSPATSYELELGRGITDLSGNAFAGATLRFTTSDGVDVTPPVIEHVFIEELDASQDGSGTYVVGTDTPRDGSGERAEFDLLLNQFGWTMRAVYADGESGVDSTSLVVRASVAAGDLPAGSDLSSKFAADALGATWTIDPVDRLAVGEDVTLTFEVRDRAGNVSAPYSLTVDIADGSATARGSTAGGDLLPFDELDTWVLWADCDEYTSTLIERSGRVLPTTQEGGNGVPDLDEALAVIGLRSESLRGPAARIVRGDAVGANAIVRARLLERVRALVRERFGIRPDGVREEDSPHIEFLLHGERGPLTSLPVRSATAAFASSRPYSEMDLGGDPHAVPDGQPLLLPFGRAHFDARNEREEANLGTIHPSHGSLGVFCLAIFRWHAYFSRTSDVWFHDVLTEFVPQSGGVPVGEHPADAYVLSQAFDRDADHNTPDENRRSDAITSAVEAAALVVSRTVAHEIGHSIGLVPDGPPPTGLFGNARHENAFTDATDARPNFSHHLDHLAPGLMSAGDVSEDFLDGARLPRFAPLFRAYLLHRVLYDEGR